MTDIEASEKAEPDVVFLFNDFLAAWICRDGLERKFREAFDHDAGRVRRAILALDAHTTRLRDDLDRVTRERDEAVERAALSDAGYAAARENRDHYQRRAEAAEAAFAKRDEEVAAVRSDAHFLLDLLMTHAPKRITDHEEVVKVRLKIHGPEALTQEPTNAEPARVNTDICVLNPDGVAAVTMTTEKTNAE